VELAPSASFICPVQSDFPFAFTIDFQPCCIKNKMSDAFDRPCRQLNLEPAGTAAKRGVIHHRQVKFKHLDQRAEQALSGAQREVKELSDSQGADYGRVGVEAGLAAAARGVRVEPGINGRLVEPQGEASTLNEGGVILAPVLDAVRGFGILLFHKLRLPASPHP